MSFVIASEYVCVFIGVWEPLNWQLVRTLLSQLLLKTLFHQEHLRTLLQQWPLRNLHCWFPWNTLLWLYWWFLRPLLYQWSCILMTTKNAGLSKSRKVSCHFGTKRLLNDQLKYTLLLGLVGFGGSSLHISVYQEHLRTYSTKSIWELCSNNDL